jgi:hypothetical protein
MRAKVTRSWRAPGTLIVQLRLVLLAYGCADSTVGFCGTATHAAARHSPCAATAALAQPAAQALE